MAKEFFIRKEQGAKKYKGKRKREKSKAGKTERAGKRRTENDKEQNGKNISSPNSELSVRFSSYKKVPPT